MRVRATGSRRLSARHAVCIDSGRIPSRRDAMEYLIPIWILGAPVVGLLVVGFVMKPDQRERRIESVERHPVT